MSDILPFSTARLVFRAVETKAVDGDEHLRAIFTDIDNQFTSGMGVIKPLGGDKWAEKCRGYITGVPFGVWICLKPTETPSLSDLSTLPPPIGFLEMSPGFTPQCRHAEFGISLIKSAQGKGYGPEALEWLFEVGFRRYGYHTIGCGSWSERAMGVYRKLGMREEGRQKEVLWRDGEWVDMVTFGITEDEWKARKVVKAKETEQS